MKLKCFLSQTKFPKELMEAGAHGLIYRISESHCAKIPHFCGDVIKENFTFNTLYSEYQIIKNLYLGKVSVPKPEGVFNIQLQGIGKIPGLVMEYVNGIKAWQLEEKVDELNFLTLKELGKAMNLGYIPGKDCWIDSNNVLWSNERNNVVLIDFGNWEKC